MNHGHLFVEEPILYRDAGINHAIRTDDGAPVAVAVADVRVRLPEEGAVVQTDLRKANRKARSRALVVAPLAIANISLGILRA